MSGANRETVIEVERHKFRARVRKTIEGMGDLMTPQERRNYVRSRVRDYNPLSESEAETFINDNGTLIEQGHDSSTQASSLQRAEYFADRLATRYPGYRYSFPELS